MNGPLPATSRPASAAKPAEPACATYQPTSAIEGSDPPAKQISLLIADDHPVVRIGVRNLLAADGRFVVLGEAQTTAEAVQRTLHLLPDILLMDHRMPDGSCIEALTILHQRAPGVAVVMLTAEVSPTDAAEAFTAGARGLVMKSALSESISVALLAVCDGAYWAHGRRMESRDEVLQKYTHASRLPPGQSFNLTRRELEVIGMIVKGHSNREIAQQFKLSEETVKRHLSNIFEKVGISTRLELAILAIEHRLAARPGTSQAPP